MLWIFTDWDETITNEDTLCFVAPPDSSSPSGPPFSFFRDYYMRIMDEHEKAFGPRHTLERQLAYLASLDSIEEESVRNVEEHGLFKGVKEADIRERGRREVQFCRGWIEFVDECIRKREEVKLVGVLSVNWSKAFIESALAAIHDPAFMEELDIRANVSALI
jgi:hypothetical protein